MKHFFLIFSLLFSLFGFAQSEQLADYYFEKSDFEKAKLAYEELLEASPQNSRYFFQTVACYQQLQQYDLAEKKLVDRYKKYKQGSLLVELGYNYQLQKMDQKAISSYDEALERIKANPQEVFSIASNFEKKVQLDYALKAYELAENVMPNANFKFQKALLYGQLGKTEQMVTTFLDEAVATPTSSVVIQNHLARYLTDDTDGSFTTLLRKDLIVRVQKNQDLFWNHYLSWFYIQQKEYAKAFVQEKAIYKRNPESLTAIISLIQLTIEEQDQDTATDMLNFVIENSKELEILIQAHSYILNLQIEKAQQKDYAAISATLDRLLVEYEITPFTVSLQLIQAHFTAFKQNDPEKAKKIIATALALRLSDYEVAKIKMELADILLYEEQYNQALLYYTQIQLDLKNDVVAHEASLKAAKTSYFKADFEWALKQFKELKGASTQLIANDALEYYLLINDNTVADSTQTALTAFAKADYSLYQNRNDKAIQQFLSILQQFKGDEIEAVTLLRLGQIYEKQGGFEAALQQYETIITQHSDGIYVDEALFFSAEIYSKKLNKPENARTLYEKVIFNHEDSIYYVEARKEFRKLRGDTNL